MSETLDTLRVGIVGLGIGRQHLKGYQQIPGVEIVAVADADPVRLEATGAGNGIPDLYDDYRPLVARDDLDAISVCTPNFLHAPIAIAALESGKHVLCEKPLSNTLADAEAMVAAAERAGRVLEVTFNHRQRGDVQALKAYIDRGGLGRIYYAKAWWVRRRGIPGKGSWFTQKGMAGGGPLIDLGVHMLDMALYLMGEPRALTVSGATYAEFGPRGLGFRGSKKQIVGEGYEVEDMASAFIRVSGNATLLLEASWASHRVDNNDLGVILYGTEGGAEIRVIDYGQRDTLVIYTDIEGVPTDIRPQPAEREIHTAVVRNFVNVIRSGEWAGHVGREGLARTRIIDACYRSAEAGREIVL
jgi:predicted dehydrogenase